MTEPEIKSLTTTETCKLFSVTPKELFRWVKQGLPKQEVENERGGRKSFRFDPEQVRLWMINNGRGGYTKTMLKDASEIEKSIGSKPTEPHKIDNREGLLGAVNRQRVMELSSFSMYLQAHRSGDMKVEQARAHLHLDAVKALAELESIVDDRADVEKQIWFEVNEHLVKWAEPVRSLLDSMPRALAARCNPSDPVMAESVLRDWVTNQFLVLLSREVK